MRTTTPTLRVPTPADGGAIWRLVRDSGTLDLNSPYAYLMFVRRFADTCVVAEGESGLVGFVAAYRPPDDPAVLFVWQIGVDASQRGQGLGTRMLSWLIERHRKQGVTHLEATVTPSNHRSQRLFRGIARAYDADCVETPWLQGNDFPEPGYEDERLFRIGPLTRPKFEPEMNLEPPEGNPVEPFDRIESEVRSYCRAWPTVFQTAKGSHLTAEDGTRYLDFFSGAGVLNYGHNNPAFKRALLDYLDKDGVTHGLDTATTAKRTFLERFEEVVLRPRGLDYRIMFTGPTGTNAVESSLKLARKVTGRNNVVSFTNAFHGMTLGALAVTGNSVKRGGAHVPLSYTNRMPYDAYFGSSTDTIDFFEAYLADDGSGMGLPAAAIVETVQGEGGLAAASVEWQQRLADLCARHGILLIVDDIQAGCGRTGTFFSFEPAGIVPDMVTLSKSLSGYGLPFAITLLKPELDVWEPGEHNGTFRGFNPAFVTATAALAYWETDEFAAAVRRKAARVRERLTEMVEHHPDTRAAVVGRGLMQGLSFEVEGLAKQVAHEAFERGLLLETSGADDQVAKLMPPLTIDEVDLQHGLDIIEQALRAALDVVTVADGDDEPELISA